MNSNNVTRRSILGALLAAPWAGMGLLKSWWSPAPKPFKITRVDLFNIDMKVLRPITGIKSSVDPGLRVDYIDVHGEDA